MNGKNLCDIEENDRMAYYNLIFNYQGFHVEPQYNKVSIEKFDKNIFNTVYLNFNPDIKLETLFEWIIIRLDVKMKKDYYIHSIQMKNQI